MMNDVCHLDSNDYDEQSVFWTVMTMMNTVCLLDSNDYGELCLSSGQ